MKFYNRVLVVEMEIRRWMLKIFVEIELMDLYFGLEGENIGEGEVTLVSFGVLSLFY